MNKYQEALDRLRSIQVYKYATKEFYDYQVDYENSEEIKTLQELVDKATPKKIQKPMKKQKTNTRCPQCDSYVQVITNSKHCGNCGQALDWSTND